MSDRLTIGGELPWDFCCKWYSVSEIEESIRQEPDDIPLNVSSQEFAEWIAHQYRLAMHKGMDLAFREHSELRATVARLEGENQQLRTVYQAARDRELSWDAWNDFMDANPGDVDDIAAFRAKHKELGDAFDAAVVRLRAALAAVDGRD